MWRGSCVGLIAVVIKKKQILLTSVKSKQVLHDMRKICDNIVECHNNDVTINKQTLQCTQFCLSAAIMLLKYNTELVD